MEDQVKCDCERCLKWTQPREQTGQPLFNTAEVHTNSDQVLRESLRRVRQAELDRRIEREGR